ncbi:MAG: hypothetical protein C5B58_01170 [Acidobacteria bacterium]|nr:MAG: hypothetical protein C5B58_01170 [Acidobacteriota bacterium]
MTKGNTAVLMRERAIRDTYTRDTDFGASFQQYDRSSRLNTIMDCLATKLSKPSENAALRRALWGDQAATACHEHTRNPTKSSAHNVNCQNAALMTRQQVIYEITDDRVRLIAELGYHATDQRTAAAMPFQVDRAMNVARAMDLRPTMWPVGLFGPNLDETEFPL